MARLFLLLVVLLFSGPAMAAYGLSADCKNPDPSSYDDVYGCINSYRWHDGRLGVGPAFSNGNCKAYQVIYAAALRQSGMGSVTAHERKDLMPSCETLARVREDMMGEPPYWAACTGFEAGRLQEHMPGCLTNFLKSFKNRGPSYTSRDAAAELPTCEEALRVYEQALKSAAPGQEEPAGYEKPSCEVVGQVLTAMKNEGRGEAAAALAEKPAIDPQWAACLGYEAANVQSHMDRCLEGHTGGLTKCVQVIDTYERRLREAHGNAFPEGYIRPPCSAGEEIAQAEAERIAAAREAEERRRQARAQAEREQRAAAERRINDQLSALTGTGENMAQSMIRGVLDALIPGTQAGWSFWALIGFVAGVGLVGWIGFKILTRLGWEWLKRRVFGPRT